MTETRLPVLEFVTAHLPGRKAQRFALRPTAAEREAMARSAGLLELPGLVLTGEILPEGRRDFRLRAELVAEVVQACAVTLAPVPSQLHETIDRLYLAAAPPPTAEEIEVPAEDIDDLPEVLDITAIAIEALELALPLYPRAPGAELGEAVFAQPGVTPLTGAQLKPFAGLASLAEKMAEKAGKDGGKK